MPAAPLEIQTRLKILKPAQEVFESIVDPSRMSNYFIKEGSARMRPNTTVEWEFPEFPVRFPVKVKEVKENELIVFEWEANPGQPTEVRIVLATRPGNETLVTITEGKMESNEAGILWLKRNTEGWANFLASLKAFMEYEINLRKGAFEIDQMPDHVKD